MSRRYRPSKSRSPSPSPATVAPRAPIQANGYPTYGGGVGGQAWGGPQSGLYPISENTPARGWRPRLDQDVAFMLTRYKQRAMLSDARYVYTGVGQVSGAVHDKANFAVGGAWIPQYHGSNEAFRDAFREVMGRWIRNCDLRGQPYDFQADAWLASKSLDVDGEVFIALTRSEQGSPRLQFLESQRIGSPFLLDLVPEDVPGYAGQRIYNGIVFDAAMRPLAYNILPPNYSSLIQAPDPSWNLVPAGAIIPIYDPRWYSQSRGIPTLCHGILDWYDVGEIRDSTKTTVKALSRITMMEYNESGRADPGPALMANRANGDPTQIDPRYKFIESGLIRYFKAGSGNKLEAFSHDQPASTWEGFIDHIARSAHRGMDWPIEMHDMSKLGGASVRALVGQVQRSVTRRQDVLWGPLLNAVLYAVASYLRRGDLPFAVDWYDIGFSLPSKFSVDVGRDSDNRRQDVAMGLRGVDDVFAEEGEGDTEAVFRRRAKAWKLRDQVAAEEGVPPEAIYNPAAASQPAVLSFAPVDDGTGNAAPKSESD